jgi:alpha-mannosidase
MLFGIGDGGGGPTRAMLERLQRVRDLRGLPRVHIRSPQTFFEEIEQDAERAGELAAIGHERSQSTKVVLPSGTQDVHKNTFLGRAPAALPRALGGGLPKWVGELYFERHRGTYTTQCQTKRRNRLCQTALHDAEMLCTAASTLPGFVYPQEELIRLWKLVLLNQFHDVIPGSSIREVYIDAQQIYDDVLAGVSPLTWEAIRALARDTDDGPASAVLVANTLPWERHCLHCFEGLPAAAFHTSQPTHDGNLLVPLKIKPGVVSAAAAATAAADFRSAAVQARAQPDGTVVLANGIIRAVVGPGGVLLSLVHLASSREALKPGSPGANRYILFEDLPLSTDAWDIDVYHMEKSKQGLPIPPFNTKDWRGAETATVVDSEAAAVAVEANAVSGGDGSAGTAVLVVEQGPLRAGVRCALQLSTQSWIQTTILLEEGSDQLRFECEAEWQERHQFLKASFPFDLLPHQVRRPLRPFLRPL